LSGVRADVVVVGVLGVSGIHPVEELLLWIEGLREDDEMGED